MKIEDLVSGKLVQKGRTLFRVSTVYPTYATLQQVYPKLERTTVTSAPEKDLVNFGEPTAHLVARYESAWGFAIGSSRQYGEV